MELRLDVKERLSAILGDPSLLGKGIPSILVGAGNLVLREYIKQQPVNTGNMRSASRLLTNKMNSKDPEVIITTTATSRGRPYPEYIHSGTGKLKGASDYGYTTGRVRAGDIATGIGGIRPNKFANRAMRDSYQNVDSFIRNNVSRLLSK